MTTVAEITGAVKRLPKKELARFRKWFAEYDAQIWDRQLESDVAAGRLDTLVREAKRDDATAACGSRLKGPKSQRE